MKTVTALDNWLVKPMLVSIHAVHCHVESMPFAYQKGMQLGAGVRVDLLKTRKQANVLVSAMPWCVETMPNALSVLKDRLVFVWKV